MDNFIDNLVQIAVDSVDPIDLPPESEQQTTETELREYISSHISLLNLENDSIDILLNIAKKCFRRDLNLSLI